MKPSTLFYLILLLACCGCKETLLHDLDEIHANKVRLILAEGGITPYKKKEGQTWSIQVDASEITRALRLLDQSRVLKPEDVSLAQRSSSLVLSREERSQILERQLALTIEQTLERMPGVLEARVHLHRESKGIFPSEAGESLGEGSVLLVTTDALAVDEASIKALVGRASGITPNSIAITLTKTVTKHVAAPQVVAPSEDLQKVTTVQKQGETQITETFLVNIKSALKAKQQMLLIFAACIVLGVILLKLLRVKSARKKQALKGVAARVVMGEVAASEKPETGKVKPAAFIVPQRELQKQLPAGWVNGHA